MFQGKTSVKKNSYNPIWNEELIFTEMFPPLCQRIKVCDMPSNDMLLGTFYIDNIRFTLFHVQT